MTVCVFSGPSVDAATVRARAMRSGVSLVCLPPVEQGSVYRAVRDHRPTALGIVDGCFAHVPSVWHKEILWAMSEGVHVFGAASMGALRAAELEDFGMVGVGRIYRAFSTGTFAPYDDEAFEDDDEVAVLHGPPESGYVAVSEAMVNIRETLARAAREGAIDGVLRDALVAVAKREFYQRRSYRTLLGQARHDGVDGRALDALRRWLAGGTDDLKRRDALELVDRVVAFGAGRPPAKAVGFEFEHTDAWQAAVERLDAVSAGPRRVQTLLAPRAAGEGG